MRSQTLQYHRITCRAKFPCDRCVDSFMTQDGLDKHKELHNVGPSDKFTCHKCNKAFSCTLTLKNHEKRHTIRMNYTCCICREIIPTRANYQKHLKDHIEANLTCKECGQQFHSLVKYGYHKATDHSNMKPYDCPICTELFCTRHELFVHLQNHNDNPQNNKIHPIEKITEKPTETKTRNQLPVDDKPTRDSLILSAKAVEPLETLPFKKKRSKAPKPKDYVTCEKCAQIFENEQAITKHQQYC